MAKTELIKSTSSYLYRSPFLARFFFLCRLLIFF